MTTEYVTPTESDDDSDEVPFGVEDDVEVGDLSDQMGGVMDAAKGVLFGIKKASIRTRYLDNDGPGKGTPTNPWAEKKLVIEAAIGPQGVDGKGTNAGRVIFLEMYLAFPAKTINGKRELDFSVLRQIRQMQIDEARAEGKKPPKAFNEHWFRFEARDQVKKFFARGLGLSPLQYAKVNDEFLEYLQKKSFIADILKRKDSFRGEGEFRNELDRFRQVKAAEAGPDEDEDE